MSKRLVTECIPKHAAPPGDGMRWIPGGKFRMGDDNAYPEEAPSHRVTISGFWMDENVVTNANFAVFVTTAGYCTVAERPLDPAAYADADPGCRQYGPAARHLQMIDSGTCHIGFRCIVRPD
jgi:formylglycine-generating enzyme required for sulfatase activity